MRTPKKHVATDKTVTWKVRFRHNGRQTSESFPTERKARNFAKLLDAVGPDAALEQLYADEQAETSKLDDLAEQYFTFKESRVRSDRTVADYRRDYDNWIKPIFGHRQADSIAEVEVQVWVDAMGNGTLDGDLAGRTLAPKTIADRHGLLSSICKWASAPTRGLTHHNPCIGTDLPPRTKKPPKGMRPAEWAAFHPALVQIDSDAADLAEGLVSTGWRFSELAALNAYAVEDYGEGQPLYITQGFVLRRNAAGQHVIVQDAKSEASEGRRTRVDDAAAPTFRRRLENVTGDGLVFTNKNGHQWHYNNFLNRAWNPAVELAKLTRRPTPHWLRHTHVFWLILAGAQLPGIQKRVGHEDINTTIGTYGQMIDDVGDEVLARLAEFRHQLAAATKQTELEASSPSSPTT